MSNASFLLAVNLVVAGLFATAFLAATTYEKTRATARWFAIAYFLGMAYYSLEALTTVSSYPRVTVAAAFAVFLGALIAGAFGLAERYRQRLPLPLVAAFFLGCVALNIGIYDMPRSSFLRLSLYQAPYAMVEIVSAMIVARALRRRALDNALLFLLCAAAANFLVKPLFGAWLGTGASPGYYVTTLYAVLSQASGTVLAVATGLTTLAILVRDIIADVLVKSETDTLSGLYNRRGFEEHARDLLRRVDRSGLPAAIVICDLDRFKAVNDTFGHGAGDRAIAFFAERLRAGAGDGVILGRIGGEEFAIMLPGANVAAARLFAETVRVTFSTLPAPGFPEEHRMTASFGVAAVHRGDTVSDTLRRADIALYDAKNSGRDKVRVFADSAGSEAVTAPLPLRRSR